MSPRPLLAWLPVVLAFLAPVQAQEEDPPGPERPLVTKIGEHTYRLGDIEMDAKKKELRLPVTVNMREGGPMEYVLVHETGKVHESIFTTEVSPLHLQTALKLLKFETGHGDVFNRFLSPEALDEEGGTEEERGDSFDFEFVAEGAEPVLVHRLVIDGERAAPMTHGSWVFTGSVEEEGHFLAEGEGSIIAIYLDHIAMFNMTREGADIDERWGANSKAIPEIGTRGTLILKAAESDVTD